MFKIFSRGHTDREWPGREIEQDKSLLRNALLLGSYQGQDGALKLAARVRQAKDEFGAFTEGAFVLADAYASAARFYSACCELSGWLPDIPALVVSGHYSRKAASLAAAAAHNAPNGLMLFEKVVWARINLDLGRYEKAYAVCGEGYTSSDDDDLAAMLNIVRAEAIVRRSGEEGLLLYACVSKHFRLLSDEVKCEYFLSLGKSELRTGRRDNAAHTFEVGRNCAQQHALFGLLPVFQAQIKSLHREYWRS